MIAKFISALDYLQLEIVCKRRMYDRYRLIYSNINRLLSFLVFDDHSVFLGVNVTQKQTFGCCIACNINAIKTIHIDCGHRCCCLECADKCRKCRAQGCTQLHPNHLRIYPGE